MKVGTRVTAIGQLPRFQTEKTRNRLGKSAGETNAKWTLKSIRFLRDLQAFSYGFDRKILRWRQPGSVLNKRFLTFTIAQRCGLPNNTRIFQEEEQ